MNIFGTLNKFSKTKYYSYPAKHLGFEKVENTFCKKKHIKRLNPYFQTTGKKNRVKKTQKRF